MKKSIVLFYGTVNYLLGSGALVCLIAFLFNLLPENPVFANIDADSSLPGWFALLVNVGLVTLFGLQHSIMARPAFKRRLTRYIPESMERSTFMAATGLVTFALIGFWQPMTTVLWHVEEPVAYNSLLGIGLAGWGLVFYATFLINHFDLFGLRQAWFYFRGRPYTAVPFKLNALYRYIRHPIMSGVFIGIWFTPVMTMGHLVFALCMSLYILIGVYHEEKDLIRTYGERYLSYTKTTGKFMFPLRNALVSRPAILRTHQESSGSE